MFLFQMMLLHNNTSIENDVTPPTKNVDPLTNMVSDEEVADSVVKTYGTATTVDDDLTSCSSSENVKLFSSSIVLPVKERRVRLVMTSVNGSFSDSDSAVSDENSRSDSEESGDCVFMSGTCSDSDDIARSGDDGFINDDDEESDDNTSRSYDSMSTYSRESFDWDEELETVGGWGKFVCAHVHRRAV
jgi:hypothetical protein